MEEQACRLAEYIRDRVGDAARAVGYHDREGYQIVYLRDDLEDQYSPEQWGRFVRTSSNIHSELKGLRRRGPPEASLHSLENALFVQFYLDSDAVIFVGLESDVGRNFMGFVDDCLAHIA